MSDSGVEDRREGRNTSRLESIDELAGHSRIRNDEHSLSTRLRVQIICLLDQVGSAVDSGVDDGSIGVTLSYMIQDASLVSRFRIRGGPEDATVELASVEQGKDGTDSRACSH